MTKIYSGDYNVDIEYDEEEIEVGIVTDGKISKEAKEEIK